MEQTYNNNFHDPNWQTNQNFIPNQPIAPYYVNPNFNKVVPLYHSPSDPRFKNVSCEETAPLKVNNIDQKTDDELWIETYLSKIGKININLHSNIEIVTQKPVLKNNTKKTLKIHVAKSVLHRCINLIENLEKIECYLRENVSTISSAEWKQKTIEIGQKKDEFSGLLSQFDDSSILEQLRSTLKKRKQKRLLKKEKKVRINQEYENMLKKRKVINDNIDKWLEKMKDDVEKAKQEECLKKDADCILSEVNKKKSEARKQLNLLSLLIKLRAVREKTALANGQKLITEDTTAFMKNTEKLKTMWENALQTYSKEEQSLKVMLENNAANEVHKAISKEKKIVMDWETVLFGPKIIPCDAYWGLTCAEKDIRTFVAIRKSWDTFLVPEENKDGSRIPVGWVLPKQENWIQSNN